MSDTDGKKTLGLRGGSRPGNVKQSFSHGRTKNVVVETKRKRVVVPKPGAGKASGAGGHSPAGDPSRRPAGITDAEMERRMKALAAAKAREAEEEERYWVRRGLWTSRPIRCGDTVRRQDLVVVRPAQGLGASALDDVVGCRAERDLPAGHPLTKADISPRRGGDDG